MTRRKASRSLPVCSWQSNEKAHHQNLTRIRQLPQDIYGLILSWIPDNSDLFNLCLTSRAFLREAEKKLYRCTKLARDTLTPVLWADTILESPLKAQQLRSLTLTFDLAYLIIPDTLLSSLQLISRALRSLSNLKELILLGHPRVMMNPIFSWILDRCTFQLEEFHNELFPTSAITSFLSQQSQIRYWAQTGVYSYSTQKPCPFHFPRLTALVGDGTLVRCLTAAEHIERLSLQIHYDSQKTLNGISRFRSTLAVLDLERFPTSDITAVEMIHTLSRETPGLRLLIFWDRSIMRNCPRIQDYAHAVSTLPGLKALVLRPIPVSADTDISVASLFLEKCPSLHRIGFTRPPEAHLCSYSKDRSGNIEGVAFQDVEEGIRTLFPWREWEIRS